jgi:hypothetical protein
VAVEVAVTLEWVIFLEATEVVELDTVKLTLVEETEPLTQDLALAQDTITKEVLELVALAL